MVSLTISRLNNFTQNSFGETQMAQYPHVEWLDLHSDGNLHEVAVIKRDQYGNTYFLQLNELDMIDKRRLAGILTNRNAPNMELYELLSQITLGNGVNSLQYFHQLVKVKTPAGQIMKPQIGQIGAPGMIAAQQQQQQKAAPARKAPPAA